MLPSTAGLRGRLHRERLRTPINMLKKNTKNEKPITHRNTLQARQAGPTRGCRLPNTHHQPTNKPVWATRQARRRPWGGNICFSLFFFSRRTDGLFFFFLAGKTSVSLLPPFSLYGFLVLRPIPPPTPIPTFSCLETKLFFSSLFSTGVGTNGRTGGTDGRTREGAERPGRWMRIASFFLIDILTMSLLEPYKNNSFATQ
ncbi:hypothetical protein LY76DRAFT_52329 [Colletotrichum caudatum]|nr:hypothetical protein LY76DRAFT_52329 [Colletotrichum caudatum]